MVNVALAAELQRLLTDAPYGALSAMARSLGLTSASVSAWKYGQATPERDRWRAIEEYLGLPKDHLKRANRGVVDERVAPAWPGVSATRPDDRDSLAERVALLEAEMEALRLWREEAMLMVDSRQAEMDAVRARVSELEASQRLAG